MFFIHLNSTHSFFHSFVDYYLVIYFKYSYSHQMFLCHLVSIYLYIEPFIHNQSSHPWISIRYTGFFIRIHQFIHHSSIHLFYNIFSVNTILYLSHLFIHPSTYLSKTLNHPSTFQSKRLSNSPFVFPHFFPHLKYAPIRYSTNPLYQSIHFTSFLFFFYYRPSSHSSIKQSTFSSIHFSHRFLFAVHTFLLRNTFIQTSTCTNMHPFTHSLTLYWP